VIYKQAQVVRQIILICLLDKYLGYRDCKPMHRMWSDGRWNKLTMAHGCYWGNVLLRYFWIILKFTSQLRSLLCDRMEQMMEQTGENGFHYVDEAAPPALMRHWPRILRRKLSVTWWTNIRFEKVF
jgi:hypothetical protein